MHTMHGEAIEYLERLSQDYQIASLYSHQEIGIQKTFGRDKRVADWLANKGISWKETPYGAVIRGATNREGWDKHWKQVMRGECANPDIERSNLLSVDIEEFQPPQSWRTKESSMQIGGASMHGSALTVSLRLEGKTITASYPVQKPQLKPAVVCRPILLGATSHCERCISKYYFVGTLRVGAEASRPLLSPSLALSFHSEIRV